MTRARYRRMTAAQRAYRSGRYLARIRCHYHVCGTNPYMLAGWRSIHERNARKG